MEVDKDIVIAESDCDSVDFAEPGKISKKRKNNPAASAVAKQEVVEVTPTLNMFRLKKRRIQDESDPKVTHPSGQNGKASKSQAMMVAQVVNRYDGLKNKETLDKDMDVAPEKEVGDKTRTAEVAVKTVRPPPIVVHGQFDGVADINKMLKAKLSGSFHWRNTPNSMGLYLTNKEDWVMCKQMLQENGVEFHTFSLKEEKNHAFVLRGLHQDVDPLDIRRELVEQGTPVKEVYRMKGTRFPAYLVVTTAEITLKKVEAIRFIQYTKIKWERHFNSKYIIQCHRCQAWGHATSNCHAAPSCLKCAASHLTRDCVKDPKLLAKCVNCGGAHPANNTTCNAYQKKLADMERGKTGFVAPDPRMKYVAAPQPTRNAWNRTGQAGPRLSQEEYPPLGPTRAAPSQAPVRMPQTPTTREGSGAATTFQNIENQYKRLQELINLDVMLARIKMLNDRLEACDTEAGRFEVFFTFMSSLSYA